MPKPLTRRCLVRGLPFQGPVFPQRRLCQASRGRFPNNPTLPLLVYRLEVDVHGPIEVRHAGNVVVESNEIVESEKASVER
jgi:hypothetical protein